MAIRRDIADHVLALTRPFPTVTITGPRQSGKTTLCRQLFPDNTYVSLEALDERRFAAEDLRGFLATHHAGAVLEASHLAFRLPPWHANVGRRPVRAPKTWFHDTGLACFLLGIRSARHLETHPLRGALFENYVILEVMKAALNAGRRPRLSFYRDHQGHEVDLAIDRGDGLTVVGVKSGRTIADDAFVALRWITTRDVGVGSTDVSPVLVCAGEQRQHRSHAEVLPRFVAHEAAGEMSR